MPVPGDRCNPAYNYSVLLTFSSTSQCRGLWARFTALLSLVAIFSVLVAPASLLAEEVRTGKLGGVCNVRAVSTADAQGSIGANGSPHASLHCEICGATTALPPPALAKVAMAGNSDSPVSVLKAVPRLSSAVAGLPFGRGPPAA